MVVVGAGRRRVRLSAPVVASAHGNVFFLRLRCCSTCQALPMLHFGDAYGVCKLAASPTPLQPSPRPQIALGTLSLDDALAPTRDSTENFRTRLADWCVRACAGRAAWAGLVAL